MASGARQRIAAIKRLFVLHWGERRGFMLLVVLLSVMGGAVAYRQWVYRPPPVDMEPYMAEMAAWVAERAAAQARDSMPLTPFLFDPNTVGVAEWTAMGLTERQAEGIERFKEKGGRFRVKADLARMYSLREGQYAQLEPYIDLPDSLERTRRPPRRQRWPERDDAREGAPGRMARATAAPRAFVPVEVNTADSAALVALPGIGPSFARGILRYRDMLGGYVSMDQLAEVYVLQDKPDALARMHELLVVDTLAVRRLPVNTCTAEELAAHPYARWRIARPLIAYRQQHGPFVRIEDIKGCVVVDEAVFAKLAPYLSLE